MTVRRFRRCGLILPAVCLLAGAGGGASKTNPKLLADLKRMISLGEQAPEALAESIVNDIKSDPKAAYRTIMPETQKPEASPKELVVYVWALGRTQMAMAEDEIIRVSNARGQESPQLKAVCAQALADIGGPKAGAFLLAQLDATQDSQMRFNLLNLLGEVQYEPALPKMIEVLKVDPATLYWQPIFVFGKMGDAAVPFLITMISNEQRNVRVNAITLLGQWLIPPEATTPLREQFWKENDPTIRRLILSALERTTINPDAVARFSQEVLAKETDPEVRTFAQGTLDCTDRVKENLQDFKKHKIADRTLFEDEYAELYESAGKKGLISMLEETSILADEPRLKKLRERILCRNSDEAFYDYQEVNSIVLANRRANAKSAP